MARPFSIRVFLPDGTPDGVRIVEKSNWTGVGVVVPRPLLKEAKTRPEFQRTGVYILVGERDDGELPTIYIGLGDPVVTRLSSHATKKDFWRWAVFFVTRDDSLNKAHVGHLESRLIERARLTKRAKLDNVNQPNPSGLTEADAADMDSFLDDVLSILPLLGLKVFEEPKPHEPSDESFRIATNLVEAIGNESSTGFIVRAGSKAILEAMSSLREAQRNLRQELLEQGVLEPIGDHLRFTQDFEFGSSSSAASVILGRSASGPAEWRDSSGRTLRELQESETESVVD